MQKWLIFTIWVVYRDGTVLRRVNRALGRTDDPHHVRLKGDVALRYEVDPQVSHVEWGPIGAAKKQPTGLGDMR